MSKVLSKGDQVELMVELMHCCEIGETKESLASENGQTTDRIIVIVATDL